MRCRSRVRVPLLPLLPARRSVHGAVADATSASRGRQRSFSHYDPTLKNRPGAARSPDLQPVVLSPPCRPPSAAPCWRSHLPRSSSPMPVQVRGRMQPPPSPGRHRIAMVRSLRFRSRPSASARQRSPSERLACPIDGEAPRPPAASTAPLLCRTRTRRHLHRPGAHGARTAHRHPSPSRQAGTLVLRGATRRRSSRHPHVDACLEGPSAPPPESAVPLLTCYTPRPDGRRFGCVTGLGGR